MNGARWRLTLAACIGVAACADISFVEVDDEAAPPSGPRAFVSLDFHPIEEGSLLLSVSASFRDWGEEPPLVAVGAAPLRPARDSYEGSHYFSAYDTVGFDAPSLISRVMITPPGAPDAVPDTIAVPTLHRVGQAVLCADSSGSVTLGAELGGASDSVGIYWNLWIESGTNAAIGRRVSWAGHGESVVTVPLVGLPDTDTLHAGFRISVERYSRTRAGVPVEMRTSLSQSYRIVPTGC